MKTIKWGIIGTGKIAHQFAAALKGTEGCELTAVASRTLEKAEKFAKQYGFSNAYGSYRDFAENSDADVVYIATPMASHYGDAVLCLENGKNVLCEKTVTLDTEQFAEIIALAKEKNLFFMEAMWMKCRPVYLKVLEWIKSGKIGNVRYIKADFSNYIPYDSNDRLFRLDCGGGALLDLGVYPITLTHAILGMPGEIVSDAYLGKDGVDLHNTITMRYKDGIFSSMDNGFEIQLSNNAIISGDDGYITLGRWFHCTSEAELFNRADGTVEKFVCEPLINGYEYEIMEVNRCLNEGLKESPLVPVNETMEILGIMDECRKQWGLEF